MTPYPLADRFSLALPPLFSWAHMTHYLAARMMPQTETLTEGVLRQAAHLSTGPALIEVRPAGRERALCVRVFSRKAVERETIRQRLVRQFDLGAPMRKVNTALRRDPRLAPLVRARPGLRIPGAFDPYLLAMRAVLGQQVSVKGAATLAGRLAARYGTPAAAPDAPGAWPAIFFPAPERLAREKIEGLGMPGKRAATLSTLSRFASEGGFTALENDPEARKTLEALPGIGPWTAHYILLRAFHRRDAFPASDLGLRYAAGAFLESIPSARELDKLSHEWSPYRGHAAIHLWAGLHAQKKGAKGG